MNEKVELQRDGSVTTKEPEDVMKTSSKHFEQKYRVLNHTMSQHNLEELEYSIRQSLVNDLAKRIANEEGILRTTVTSLEDPMYESTEYKIEIMVVNIEKYRQLECFLKKYDFKVPDITGNIVHLVDLL